MDDARAGLRGGAGDVAGAGAVGGHRTVEVALGAVDVGPGGAVDDRLGAEVLDDPQAALGVGDVEVGALAAGDVVAERGRPLADAVAEHPARARDQELHRIPISELSPTMNR